MTEGIEPNSEPVTVLVERKVSKSKEAKFVELLKGIIAASSNFSGYRGTDVFTPLQCGDDEYRVIFRFDSMLTLKRWEASEERAHWVEKIDALLGLPAELQVITGLETWFAFPRAKAIVPPPRFKMAIVTWLAITPLIIFFNYLTRPILEGIAMPLQILASTPFVVLIMTYLWMPLMAKIFATWLYGVDPIF